MVLWIHAWFLYCSPPPPDFLDLNIWPNRTLFLLTLQEMNPILFFNIWLSSHHNNIDLEVHLSPVIWDATYIAYWLSTWVRSYFWIFYCFHCFVYVLILSYLNYSVIIVLLKNLIGFFLPALNLGKTDIFYDVGLSLSFLKLVCLSTH